MSGRVLVLVILCPCRLRQRCPSVAFLHLWDLGDFRWCLSSYWGCEGLSTLPPTCHSSKMCCPGVTAFHELTHFVPSTRHEVGATAALTDEETEARREEPAMPPLLPPASPHHRKCWAVGGKHWGAPPRCDLAVRFGLENSVLIDHLCRGRQKPVLGLRLSMSSFCLFLWQRRRDPGSPTNRKQSVPADPLVTLHGGKQRNTHHSLTRDRF